jgi:hypothetical protein
VTGFDVYGAPFDLDTGYARYDHGRFRILVLRSEDLHRAAPVLADFLGVPGLELPRANSTDAKWLGELYRRFCDAAPLPAPWLEAAYTLPVATHFYGGAERAGFRARWSRRPESRPA